MSYEIETHIDKETGEISVVCNANCHVFSDDEVEFVKRYISDLHSSQDALRKENKRLRKLVNDLVCAEAPHQRGTLIFNAVEMGIERDEIRKRLQEFGIEVDE